MTGFPRRSPAAGSSLSASFTRACPSAAISATTSAAHSPNRTAHVAVTTVVSPSMPKTMICGARDLSAAADRGAEKTADARPRRSSKPSATLSGTVPKCAVRSRKIKKEDHESGERALRGVRAHGLADDGSRAAGTSTAAFRPAAVARCPGAGTAGRPRLRRGPRVPVRARSAPVRAGGADARIGGRPARVGGAAVPAVGRPARVTGAAVLAVGRPARVTGAAVLAVAGPPGTGAAVLAVGSPGRGGLRGSTPSGSRRAESHGGQVQGGADAQHPGGAALTAAGDETDARRRGAPTVVAMSEASADREFAVTSVISAGSSRGAIALRVTPKAFCSTRTPKAAGSKSAGSLCCTATAMPQHSSPRASSVPARMYRRPCCTLSSIGPMNGASTANGAIVTSSASATLVRAWSSETLKNRVPASATATNASPGCWRRSAR